MFAWVPFLPGDVGSDVHAQDVVRTSHTYATEFKRRKWAVDRLHISQENRQSFTFAANDADHITTAEWSDNEDEKKIGDSLDHIDVHSNLAKAHGVNGNLVALWGEKLGKTTLKVEFQRRVSDLPEPPKKGDSGELDFHSILAHRNKTKLHVELEAVDFGVGAPLVPPTPPTPTPPTPEAPEEKNGDDAAKKTETPPAESAPAAASETAATAEADAKPEAKAEEGKGEEKAAEEKKGGETPAEASKPNDSKPAEPEKKPEPKQRFATLRGKVLVAPGMEHEHWYAKASPLVHILNGKEKFETGFKKDTEQNKNEWNQEFTLKIEVAEQDGTLVAVHPLHFEIRDHSSFWKNTVLAEAELSIADLKHEEKVERELLLINEDITAFVTGNKELATHHLVHAHYVHNYLASLGWAGSFRYSYGTIDITDGKIPTGSFAFQLDIPLAATEYSELEKPAGLAGNVQDWLSSFVSNAHHLAVVLTEGLASAESQNTTGSSGTVSFDERLAFGGKDVRLQLVVGLEDLVNASKAADARAKAAAEKAAAEKAAAEKAAAEKAEKEAAEKAAKAAADKAAAEAAAAAHPEPEKAKEKAGEPTEPVAAKEGEKAAEAEAPPAVEKA